MLGTPQYPKKLFKFTKLNHNYHTNLSSKWKEIFWFTISCVKKLIKKSPNQQYYLFNYIIISPLKNNFIIGYDVPKWNKTRIKVEVLRKVTTYLYVLSRFWHDWEGSDLGSV